MTANNSFGGPKLQKYDLVNKRIDPHPNKACHIKADLQ